MKVGLVLCGIAVLGTVLALVGGLGFALKCTVFDKGNPVCEFARALKKAKKQADTIEKLQAVDEARIGLKARKVDLSEFNLNKKLANNSPPNVARKDTFYNRCDCGQGLENVTIWLGDDKESASTVNAGEIAWLDTKDMAGVEHISFFCDGEEYCHKHVLKQSEKEKVLSLVFGNEKYDGHFGQAKKCGGKETGLLRWNTYAKTEYTSSIPFTTGTEGYFCFKIPAMLLTSKGTLIAFSEARTPDCSDFAQTDMVYKRSTDGGRTWGPLKLLVDPPNKDQLGLCGHKLVIGNIAPVQLRNDDKHHPGRILVPYTRDNFKSWIVHSDDDGETFENDREIENVVRVSKDGPDCKRGMTYFGHNVDSLSWENADDILEWIHWLCVKPDAYHDPDYRDKLTGDWQWVGIGPPGAIQLESGKVLVPAYHSYIRGVSEHAGGNSLPTSQLFNNFALGHTLISEDGGDTWRLGWEGHPIGNGFNENQYQQLRNGSILANSRSLSTGSPQWRLQAISHDEGETFTPSRFVYEQPEPFNGCQGSMSGYIGQDTVYVGNPDPPHAQSLLQHMVDKLECPLSLTGRNKLTIWKSTDGGKTYPEKTLLDDGLSAQTSIQVSEKGKVFVMYEQADPAPFSIKGHIVKKVLENMVILLPTRMVVREIPQTEFTTHVI